MDMFTHAEIAAVLSEFKLPDNAPPFLLSTFNSAFTALQGQEKIYFDRISPDNRIAALVSPRVAGKARTKKGFSVDSYEPAYIKEYDNYLPTQSFTRRPGDPLNGKLSPSEHYAAAITDMARQQLIRIRRTLNIMASQLYRTGGIIMAGDGIKTELSYGRNVANTITLATNKRWLDANVQGATPTADPLEDLESWLNLCIEPVRILVMGNAAWRAIRKSPTYKTKVDIESLRGTSDFMPGFQQETSPLMGGVTYRGTLYGAGIPIYTYTATYVDLETGSETLYLPTDSVIGIPDFTYGYQCYAAIQDADADYEAREYFFKNWKQQDPSVVMIMTQCAPLLAHTKINSTFCANTGATLTGA